MIYIFRGAEGLAYQGYSISADAFIIFQSYSCAIFFCKLLDVNNIIDVGTIVAVLYI